MMGLSSFVGTPFASARARQRLVEGKRREAVRGSPAPKGRNRGGWRAVDETLLLRWRHPGPALVSATWGALVPRGRHGRVRLSADAGSYR